MASRGHASGSHTTNLHALVTRAHTLFQLLVSTSSNNKLRQQRRPQDVMYKVGSSANKMAWIAHCTGRGGGRKNSYGVGGVHWINTA
jgi:hypothetical protein